MISPETRGNGCVLFFTDVTLICSQIEDKEDERESCRLPHVTSTEFFEWSCKMFVQPINRLADEEDPESSAHVARQFRFERNLRVRTEAKEEQAKAGTSFS